MPPRPPHLPHNIEREALQKMSPIYGLPLAKLHPAGKRTVAQMLAKGLDRTGFRWQGRSGVSHHSGRGSRVKEEDPNPPMSQSRFALVTRVGCSARWTPGLLELGLKARDLIIEAMEESPRAQRADDPMGFYANASLTLSIDGCFRFFRAEQRSCA